MPVLASQVSFRLKATRAREEDTSVGTNTDLRLQRILVSSSLLRGIYETTSQRIVGILTYEFSNNLPLCRRRSLSIVTYSAQ